MSTIPSLPPAASIQGDAIQGDKFGGDKVLRDKITYILNGQPITMPGRAELLAYLAAIGSHADFKRWADLPMPSDEPLFVQSQQQPDSRLPDTYIETRALPMRVASHRPQAEGSQVAVYDLMDVVQQASKSVILGEPGSGKTSALQRMAWQIATQMMGTQMMKQASEETSESLITLPIFARLANYQNEADLIPLLRRALNSHGGHGGLALEDDLSTRQFLRVKNVQFVLLLDGLNELNRDLSEQGLTKLQNHLFDFPLHQVYITCRTADFETAESVLPGVPRWIIQSLVDSIRYWDDKEGTSDVRDYLRMHLGEEAGKRLYTRLGQDERLKTLAQIPLFLWMLKETAGGANEGDLPPDRGSLLRDFVRKGIFEKRLPKALRLPAEEGLEQIAWHSQAAGRMDCQDAEMDTILQTVRCPRGVDQEALRLALLESGLLIALDEGGYKLLHHLVREYGAAAHLVRQPACGQQLPQLAQQEDWRECIILALWLRKELHTPDYLLGLMGDALVDLRVRVEAARILAQVGDPRLAVRQTKLADGKRISFIEPAMIAIPAGNAVLGGQDEDAYDDELPQCVVPVAAFALAVHPVTNAEFKCFVDAGGYEDESLWTPGGQGWLRGEGKMDAETEQQLRSEHQYISRDVEAWVTHMKREQAMSEETADQWRRIATWSEDRYIELYTQQIFSEKRRQPYYWQDSRYNFPNQPVVGVNWYEAMAYAEWLSRVTDNRYMLPSEAEWEWAARRQASGQPVRKYPWGNDWEADRCNWSGSRLNQGSPIGCFPQGATLDGLQDLAGNVYEWTRSLYRPYPYVADDGREDATADGLRVYRGGSWYTDRRRVRCACRFWFYPWHWNYGGGMRLARAFL